MIDPLKQALLSEVQDYLGDKLAHAENLGAVQQKV
jgi:hypothetical protein